MTGSQGASGEKGARAALGPDDGQPPVLPSCQGHHVEVRIDDQVVLLTERVRWSLPRVSPQPTRTPAEEIGDSLRQSGHTRGTLRAPNGEPPHGDAVCDATRARGILGVIFRQ